MNELQEKLLEMMAWLHNFCVKNNITYYITGGTLLGAVRHKGFIPWDDDIDIDVPRNDYMRLLKLLEKPIDHYYIESPYSCKKDFPYSFAKFYDTTTSLTENFRKPFTRSVFIDIFPLDGLSNNKKENKKHLKKLKRKYAFYISKIAFFSKTRAWYKNVFVFLNRFLPYSDKKVQKKALKLDNLRQKYDYKSSNLVGFFGGPTQDKDIFSKEVYGNPRLYDFQNYKFYGPNNYDAYLTLKYGDYLTIPPKEKQIRHALNADLNK